MDSQQDTDMSTLDYFANIETAFDSTAPQAGMVAVAAAVTPIDTNLHHAPTPHRASFLDLPGELRTLVYVHALRSDTAIYIRFRYASHRDPKIKEKGLALCVALPLLRREILSVYYGENTFHLSFVKARQRQAFESWVRRRGVLLEHLRSVRVQHRVCFRAGYTWPWARAEALISLGRDGKLVAYARATLFTGVDYCRCGVLERVDQLLAPAHSARQQELERETPLRKNVVSLLLDLCRSIDLDKEMPYAPDRYGVPKCPNCGNVAMQFNFRCGSVCI